MKELNFEQMEEVCWGFDTSTFCSGIGQGATVGGVLALMGLTVSGVGAAIVASALITCTLYGAYGHQDRS